MTIIVSSRRTTSAGPATSSDSAWTRLGSVRLGSAQHGSTRQYQPSLRCECAHMCTCLTRSGPHRPMTFSFALPHYWAARAGEGEEQETVCVEGLMGESVGSRPHVPNRRLASIFHLIHMRHPSFPPLSQPRRPSKYSETIFLVIFKSSSLIVIFTIKLVFK